VNHDTTRGASDAAKTKTTDLKGTDMYVADFLPVGDGQDSGDAIAMQFTNPETGTKAVAIIDAGFKDDGAALVEHVRNHYDTATVELAILTHPDGDHIGGMGEVVRNMNVQRLWLHDIGARGGAGLPAADAVDELIAVAAENGTIVQEPWAGVHAFGGALTILGPTKDYYEQLVREQLTRAVPVLAKSSSLREAAFGLFSRIAGALPIEVPFDAKEVTPRNNTSIITHVAVDGKNMLFTGDAGVPALDQALDRAESLGIVATPDMVQISHHGSRRNASSAWLDRLLGGTGQAETRSAYVSVVPNSDKHPSGRVVNAYKRRGCRVVATAGKAVCYGDWAGRPNWFPVEGLGPMQEEIED
jgi:beta-lactamase superfamily II metal-dependent hydrolase